MLADLMLEHGQREFSDAWGAQNWREFAAILSKAQKFVLDRSLGDVLGDMPRKEVRAALPFCRLPFPTVWIEIAQADRAAFCRLPVTEGLYQPVRVGVLCEQAGDDPGEFYASLIWSFSPADTSRQFMQSPVNMSSGALYVNANLPHTYRDKGDTGPGLDEPFTAEPIISRYFRAFLEEVSTEQPDLLETFKAGINNDWQGEIWFWLAALAMLNARNGARSIPRPVAPALAKARRKAGKPALMDYHELTIRLTPGEARERRASGPRSAQHAHVVRGHFKVRKTGIYWWSPHIRGELTGGFTGKHYKVKA